MSTTLPAVLALDESLACPLNVWPMRVSFALIEMYKSKSKIRQPSHSIRMSTVPVIAETCDQVTEAWRMGAMASHANSYDGGHGSA